MKKFYNYFYNTFSTIFQIFSKRNHEIWLRSSIAKTIDIQDSTNGFKHLDRSMWDEDIVRVLGKLSLKIEAAGKVRVFAMVDPITQ